MSSRCRRRLREDDDGAVLVEFAFIALTLFTMLIGVSSFALAEMGDTVGTNAARDGARVGILYYANADQPSSPGSNNDKVFQAVVSRLSGLVRGTPTVTIKCYTASGALLPGSGRCDPTTIIPGSDQIDVSVTWTRITLPPFGGASTRTDSARLTIVGTPPTSGGGSTPPGSCTLSNVAVTGSPAGLSGSSLTNDVTIAVDLSSFAACGAPTMSNPYPSDALFPSTVQMAQVGTSNTFRYTVDRTVTPATWTAGTRNLSITALNGGTASASFVVSGASSCTIGTITVSAKSAPTNQIKVKSNGQTEVLNGPITFTVAVNSTSSCGTVTLALEPANAGSLDGVGQTMTATNSTTYGYDLANGDRGWDPGVKTIRITSSSGVTATSTVTVTT